MLDPLLSSRTKTPSPKLTSYSAEENEKKFLFLFINTSVAFGGSSQKSRLLRALQSPQVTPPPGLEKARFSLQRPVPAKMPRRIAEVFSRTSNIPFIKY